MRIVLLIVAATTLCAFGHASATNYYLSPGGSDGNSGTSTTNAWASLQHARSHGLSAGDTLFIMGGTYSTDNYFNVWDGSIYGTVGHPVVFKAYGDSPAIFTHSGSTFFQWGGAYNRGYVTIDGFSRTDPDSPYWIRFRPDANSPAINISPGGTSTYHYTNFVIRGIEIDGSSSGGRLTYPFSLEGCDSFLVDHVYIHHVYHPTGDVPPGDGSDRGQGTGECMFLKSCSGGKILNSTFKYANHGLVCIERTWVGYAGHISRYITIKNCLFENYWGGGLYINLSSEYCLVENNIFAHSGESTTFVKPAIQVSGSHHTIRGNVFYNPRNQPVQLAGLISVGGDEQIVNYNYIYNNTFFKNGKGYNLQFFNNNASAASTTEYNVIANNIFYKLAPTNVPRGNIWVELYHSSFPHNWVDPDDGYALPGTTSWGHNQFMNNCLRVNDRGAAWDSMVVYDSDSHLPHLGGHLYPFTIAALEADGSGAWAHNIGSDPMFTSEDPDGYGLSNGWWHLQGGSQCINAGTPIIDANGPYAEANCPGYGWGNLSFQGPAPDIGANEQGYEPQGPPVPPALSCNPGRN